MISSDSKTVQYSLLMVLSVVVLNYLLRFILNSNLFPCVTSPRSWSGVQR